MAESNPTGPLTGIRVLDLTRVLSGPFATMVLADLGADVIKIEDPVRGDDTRHWGPPFVESESAYFMSVNRNKRSLALDLKSDRGREIARTLAAEVDVIVENFRPGVAARLGLGYEAVRGTNPGVIYASISGYGHKSSESDKPGYDPIMQARSGLMSITGEADGGPARVGVASADISAGLWTAIGTLAALHHRTATGRGQWIDLSLLDAQVSWLSNVAGAWFASGGVPARYGTGHPSIVPSEAFATSDGLLMLAAGNDAMWDRMAAALGVEQLVDDPRFETNPLRVAHRDDLRHELEQVLATDTTAAWLERLDAAAVPAARVNSIGEALSDPLLRERDMIVELEHQHVGLVRSVGSPVKLSETPPSMRSAPPVLGQDTRAVLAELGLDPTEIQDLIDQGQVTAAEPAPTAERRLRV
ncbi:CoA transferase [Ornithinimicrobium faecis]|uniref:CoA transferase n=1 Tax=Ornithinimicrobium faecis TaxID=2934158 RepID=A0ABY4YX76_9MICO|nr:CoA transferase [Ornithinimicrobium sp. HY1793]USQ81383.1 CoA transferase [Ornithinimicrobium sp. HY1793]